MLIYNYKKEFLGIDQNNLEILGLSNLADLRKEAADFADLFVKTPGYIHNFKNVHWIDYIICSDSGVEPKAIINIKGKNYSTSIDIQTIYLIDNPSQKAFMVNLTNIKPLSHAQSEKISADILEKSTPITATGSAELFTVEDELDDNISQISYDPYESDDAENNSNIIKDDFADDTLEVDLAQDEPVDFDMDIGMDAGGYIEEVNEKNFDENKASDEIEQTNDSIQNIEKELAELEESSNIYIFNPQVASEELGLPIDLVEEFIQDFIAQAKSFKDELYEAAAQSDFDTLKILSHKLKGVAANLRVEDALETLTIINSSNDSNEITQDLDKLYKIIDKLSNKDNSLNRKDNDIQVEADEQDEFVLSLKVDEPELNYFPEESIEEKTSDEPENLGEDVIIKEIDDSDVPDNIDIVELVDDEFLKQDIDLSEDDFDYEELSILDEPMDDMSYDTTQNEALDIAISYDKELVANDIGLDLDSFNELFNDYINESKELTDSIINSIKNDNLGECKSAAIKLKGMSENMRIHKFDDELNAIIKSTNINGITDFIDLIVSKLNEISSKVS